MASAKRHASAFLLFLKNTFINTLLNYFALNLECCYSGKAASAGFINFSPNICGSFKLLYYINFLLYTEKTKQTVGSHHKFFLHICAISPKVKLQLAGITDTE